METFSEICLDIETAPDVPPKVRTKLLGKIQEPQTEEELYNSISAPKNYKKQEKIDAYIDNKRLEVPALIQTQQEEYNAAVAKIDTDAALSPRTGKIIVVGIGIRQGSDEGWENIIFVDRLSNEKGLLEAVDKAIYGAQPRVIYTFNGRLFDYPFLATRAMKYKMELKHKWPMGRDDRHRDLFDLFGRKGSLEDWSLALLGRGKPSGGHLIYEMFEQERWAEIEEHCLADIEITEEIVDAALNTTTSWRDR